jgi:hypothetical protein
MTYLCPDGLPLYGTLETLTGTAVGYPTLVDGRIRPVYTGHTEVHYDEQNTVVRDGEIIWVCEEGAEHTQSSLVAQDEEDESPEDES